MGLLGSSTRASLTEHDLPDQKGKVFIVTGATSGIGKLLAGILYQKNATVYLAARSEAKAQSTIEELKATYSSSTANLVFLKLDLNDLTTIKASAEEFLRKENRLDVLWNNAGVMIPPQGSLTKQNHELQLGTNCLAPFLFTKLLTHLLVKTAKSSPAGDVRVVWVSSDAARVFSPKGGVVMDNLDYKVDKGAWHKYGVSKAGNIFHATEYARQYKGSGIISVSLNPGNLKTDLYRHVPWWQKPVVNLALKDPITGAYTELYAGLSSEVTMEKSGAWIEPIGEMKQHSRDDIVQACIAKADGGTGSAERFWDWAEEQVKSYV